MMQRNLKGQILVIVIIVLFMLSIIVMGVIAVVTRDVEQSLSAEQYELSFAKSEQSIMQVVSEYSNVETSLADSTAQLVDNGFNCSSPILEKYECRFLEDDMETIVSIEDVRNIEDYELAKDETLRLGLDNYKESIEISWTGESALDLSLILLDPDSDAEIPYSHYKGYQLVKDVYDPGGFVLTDTATNHPFNPTDIQSGNLNRVIFDISNVQGLKPRHQTLYLNIKALAKDYTSTLVSLRANPNFPVQVRKLEAISYYKDTDSSASVPIAVTQIPLNPKMPEVFNYVLRSETEVSQ